MTANLRRQEAEEEVSGRHARLLAQLDYVSRKLSGAGSDRQMQGIVLEARVVILCLEIELKQAIEEKNRRPMVERL